MSHTFDVIVLTFWILHLNKARSRNQWLVKRWATILLFFWGKQEGHASTVKLLLKNKVGNGSVTTEKHRKGNKQEK